MSARNAGKDQEFMTIVTTSEAQVMLPRLLASVAQGEEVLITDGGLPVARLIQPAAPKPVLLAQTETPEAESGEEDDRPWRGVFAIEGPGGPYPGGQLHLPSEPQLPETYPADILWDRVNATDD
jgi:antitoxin (DNA-binding transcriptional repressor) of toxin-antitoxin stability system